MRQMVKRAWVVAILGVLGACLLGAGPVAADEGGIEDNPPSIVAGELSPSSLSYEGGNVQIRAEIVDDLGLFMTYVQIYRPDGSTELIQLFEGYEHNYFATLEVPPNSSDQPVEYGVEVQAYDTNGAYVASLIGGVQEEAAPQFDESPYVTSAELNPSFLPSEGGTVTISADAGDNRGLAGLFALVTLPGGGSVQVPMNPTSSSHFEGTYEVPANAGPLAAEYPVEVVAQDDIGQEGRGLAGTITVAAPPPPPSSGRLEISPGDRSFGTVKVGKTAQRQLVVRNLPRKGGGPVEATAVVYGSSAFSLAGSSSAVHFVLQPGEKRAFTLAFRPTAPGQQFGAFELIRDDGAQPNLAVALSGKGSR
jgi:Abnormal spindle-like microcephaly-assoc'd, ASPM-SPD-2-Hydin